MYGISCLLLFMVENKANALIILYLIVCNSSFSMTIETKILKAFSTLYKTLWPE